MRDGTDASLGGELVFGREAFADVAEFGEDWAAQKRPARGNDMTMRPSSSSAIALSMRDESLAISGRGRSSTATKARAISLFASASASLAKPVPQVTDDLGSREGGRPD